MRHEDPKKTLARLGRRVQAAAVRFQHAMAEIKAARAELNDVGERLVELIKANPEYASREALSSLNEKMSAVATELNGKVREFALSVLGN